MSDDKRSFRIRREGNFIFVGGYINEHADFSKVDKSGPAIAINLEEVEYINSTGCKQWLTFIEELEAEKIEYHSVSITMMSAISMLPRLMPPGGKDSIKSFFLPFYCLNCNAELTLLTKPENIHVQEGSYFADLGSCEFCGSPVVITEEDSEFLYLYV